MTQNQVPHVVIVGGGFGGIAAARALRNDRGRFQFWWMVTIVLAAVSLVGTALEWKRLITVHHLTISANLFGTTFYSLVGLHATHVLVGLSLLGLVLVLSLRGHLKKTHHEHVEMISWYWHSVNAVWVIVFTVVYIIGR